MFRKSFVVMVTALGLATSTAFAVWSVFPKGAWPQDWPKHLEPLRDQSGSMRGGIADLYIHSIPFTKREEFEAAWPHLLSIKTKGAPIILHRSPHKHWSFGEMKAGVLIHCPFSGDDKDRTAQPIAGVQNLHERWMHTNYLELTVDGEIVDLNRIPLPPDTPIVDERFKEPSEQAKPK